MTLKNKVDWLENKCDALENTVNDLKQFVFAFQSLRLDLQSTQRHLVYQSQPKKEFSSLTEVCSELYELETQLVVEQDVKPTIVSAGNNAMPVQSDQKPCHYCSSTAGCQMLAKPKQEHDCLQEEIKGEPFFFKSYNKQNV